MASDVFMLNLFSKQGQYRNSLSIWVHLSFFSEVENIFTEPLGDSDMRVLVGETESNHFLLVNLN